MGSPLTSGPTGVTVDATTGKISISDYCTKAGAVATFSAINPYAKVNNVVSGLPSGQVLYIAEAGAQAWKVAPLRRERLDVFVRAVLSTAMEKEDRLHASRKRSRQRGSVLIMFTLMLPVVITLVGLAIDRTMLFLVEARLSSAVDGSALAPAAVQAESSTYVSAERITTAVEVLVWSSVPGSAHR